MYINRSQQDGGSAEAHAADKAVQMFRSNVMFQFEGTGEEGLGRGVEREMIDFCKGMLNGHSGPSSSATSTATNNKAATVINNGGANYRIFERGIEVGTRDTFLWPTARPSIARVVWPTFLLRQ